MDNATHTLFGAALAKTKLGRLHRLAPLSLIVGANLPDSDIVVGLFGGKNAFLIHHRGVTHALLGVVVEALLLAGVMRWFERWRAKADAPAGWSPYLWPAFVGLLSHPLLDALNTYGVRPWLPFDDTRYFADLVFIVDPWLWLLFGGVALLAGRRTRLGTAAWIALGVALTAVIYFSWSNASDADYVNHRTPDHVKVAWPFAVGLLVALRVAGVGALRPGPILLAGSLLFASYLGGLEWCARTAVANALARPLGSSVVRKSSDRVPPRFVMRSPTVADPFHWALCFEGDHDEIRWRGVALDGTSTRIAQRSDGDLVNQIDDPRAQRAMALPAAAAWRYFVRVPTARIERAADGSDHVFLSDARFQWGRGLDWCVVEIDLPKEGGAADGAGEDKAR